jgi:hypothetical protein
VKRAGLLLCVVALAAALSCPSAALARGNGWKDLLIGAGLGTGLGTAIGGATTMFISPQYQQDHVFPIHYMYGASIGLVVGLAGGALVGYLPGKDDKAKKGYVDPLLEHFELPVFAVVPLEVDPGKYEKGYFLYPVRATF